MIEKDIFKALKGAFSTNDVLQHIKLWSFEIEGTLKPFIVFQWEGSGDHTARIHLGIESDYKGLAEISDLKKELRSISPRGMRRKQTHEDTDYGRDWIFRQIIFTQAKGYKRSRRQ